MLWEQSGKKREMMVFREGTDYEVLGQHEGRRSKWKTPLCKVGAGRTVHNTCHFKPVINDHKELKVWRLKINVVIYQKKTMKYT